MAREKYLIDTNVVIDFLGELLPEKALSKMDEIIDKDFYLSVINKIELLGFEGIKEDEELLFHEFINTSILLELNSKIIDKTIDLRKHYAIKLPDAIIAASALENDLIILTRNIKDFSKIKSLGVLNPYEF